MYTVQAGKTNIVANRTNNDRNFERRKLTIPLIPTNNSKERQTIFKVDF